MQRLDGVADRLMYRLTYRNFGDHEALVVNHTVRADGTDRAGVRWYEVRNPNVAVNIYQQGTFAPNDGLYRWMGSAAMDHNGNLALGYSVANSVTYPSIRATGRLASDPLGSMSQAETIIVTGTGSQTGTAGRWGDYSTLSIDPVDDCTFWYSQEYVKVTGPANWLGRVASFKFPSCNLGLGGLTGKITDSATTNPISNVLITASLGPTYSVSTLSDASGSYALSVISGSYRLLAATYGYLPATLNGILITSTVMTTQNIMLTPAPLHVVSGTIRDATAGWPLYARLQISGNPIDPPGPLNDVWTDPVSGFYSISLAEGISYTFKATAWVTGYLPTNSTIKLTKDATQNISVSADPATCLAPGYQYTRTGLVQNFETWPPAGWSIVDNIPGPSLVWDLDSVYTDTNYTGGSGHAADVNSDHNNGTPYDTELRSPIINLAILPPMQLRYKLNYQDFSLGKDAFDVDISTNSGSSWTNLRHFTSNRGSHYSLPGATDAINLAAYASQTNVILRWRYYSLEAMPWDWYAQIDEVNLVSCTPQAGGLVVGNSYSGTLAYPLANVQVA
ncbi:MAG TPA: carboxypeptidase regulatory-like domain-containing protein, partial [Anaerolineae bacterium]|nr:carboxypeptidase regulatory-like domain-containing protein [Anaerolineae bacterium]